MYYSVNTDISCYGTTNLINMKLPTIHGFIDRRILINFTADPKDVEKIIPELFRPKVYKGKAIVGICLIRLKKIKPKGLPNLLEFLLKMGLIELQLSGTKTDKLKKVFLFQGVTHH